MSESREQRRYPRYEAAVTCTLKLREGPLTLLTADVSRHGAFLRTDAPRPERELIQIHFATPVGPVDALCMVVRRYPLESPGARGPGMGVDFFAISKDAKDLWDTFVADLKIRRGTALLSPPAGAPTPPAPEREADRRPLPKTASRAPVERQHVRQKACFLVRMADKSRLRDFLSTDVSQGGMFLRTPVLRALGDLVEMVLVHPETQEEFPLTGHVVRVVEHDDQRRRGLGIRFEPLTGERLEQLVTFIETGAAALRALEATGEHRLVELQKKAAEEPSSADTQLAMGVTLLERGDVAGAVSALTKAVVLAPDRVEVHRALEVAYRIITDEGRARAHARVAEALEERQRRISQAQGAAGASGASSSALRERSP